METSCTYTDTTMYVSSDQQKIINKVRKLLEQHPDEVTILRQPEQNDGCIYATMPSAWLKISPPRTVELSDERKAELAERLKVAREVRANNTVYSERT